MTSANVNAQEKGMEALMERLGKMEARIANTFAIQQKVAACIKDEQTASRITQTEKDIEAEMTILRAKKEEVDLQEVLASMEKIVAMEESLAKTLDEVVRAATEEKQREVK